MYGSNRDRAGGIRQDGQGWAKAAGLTFCIILFALGFLGLVAGSSTPLTRATQGRLLQRYMTGTSTAWLLVQGAGNSVAGRLMVGRERESMMACS